MKQLPALALLVSASMPSLISGQAYAQTLVGKITNQHGKSIAGAQVLVEGTEFKTVTNNNGDFSFSDLPAEVSEVHISAPGYAHLHQKIDQSKTGNVFQFVLQPSPIEVIDVVSTPLHLSAMESSMPVSVLAGESLRQQQSSTLGDTLEKVVGVHTSFHANVASTPIIRGLSGPRVMITQNGLDVGDVSRVGPDHSVASESSTAEQIEVLRGPATLSFGSGAIGGVVNVVDSRVPTDNTTQGDWLLESGSVDNKKLASFNATTGFDSFAFYADGYWRDSDDYEVPVSPESEEDHHDDSDNYTVANSSERSSGFTLGGSYLFEGGYLGMSVEQFNREYGIPGHSHGETEEDHDEHEEHGAESHGDHDEESVLADLEQTRVQIQGSFNFDSGLIDRVNLRGGLTDYEHVELENGTTGTVFKSESQELRVDLLHDRQTPWRGALSLHYKNTDFSALGSEAFTPPSETEMLALAIMEERRFDDVLVQLGARIESVEISAPEVPFPELSLHAHDDHDDHDDHDEHGDHDEHHSEAIVTDYDFTPISVSAGLVWDFTKGYNLGVSLSRSERAPSAAELMSFGPHIGTRTYEVGALFKLHQEHDEAHFDIFDSKIEKEVANNIDLTLRKTEGNVGFILNAFYNQVDNYYYQTATDLFAEVTHDHGSEHSEGGAHDEHDEHDIHSGELPVYVFTTDDVTLTGMEAQIAWQVNSEFKTSLFADYVRAELRHGGDLPRTPPLRVGLQLNYQTEHINAQLDVVRYDSQDKVAKFETTTDGYTLVDASVSYDFSVLDKEMSVYLKGKNLTNTEARVHTSFLKEVAPRPGRSIDIGVKGYF